MSNFKVEIDSDHFKVPEKMMVPLRGSKERSQSAPAKGVYVGEYIISV